MLIQRKNIMNQKNNSNAKKILIIIILLGVILRVGFALIFGVDAFQIDFGLGSPDVDILTDDYYDGIMNFDRKFLGEGGHIEYILTIYKTRTFTKYKCKSMLSSTT